mmetsp:Transcript_62217/g.148403  ORF Transcript_62217/g.148403 Transcript_62217/m.148403 type:complete len:81 (-) Transcript_62217:1064-1306(-)
MIDPSKDPSLRPLPVFGPCKSPMRPFESCASGMAGAVPQLGLDPGRCPGKVEAEPRELGSGLPAEDLRPETERRGMPDFV